TCGWVRDKARMAEGIVEGGEVTDVGQCRGIGTNCPSHRRLLCPALRWRGRISCCCALSCCGPRALRPGSRSTHYRLRTHHRVVLKGMGHPAKRRPRTRGDVPAPRTRGGVP